ncbi:hypothetical protein C8R44DRAFT_882004 [Mycena epipterygia]|nr:hypothetical protein C8R44DRAFT_882004 [Mycena epipterygia]
MGPLLLLIPALKWRAGTVVSLRRSPTPEEWARFDYYAHRIRVVALESNEKFPIDTPIYQQIHKEHKTPLLPNLQKLISIPLANEAFLFAPPSLRYIRFESDDNVKTLKLLSDVAARAPALDTLRVDLTHDAGSKVYEGLEKLTALRMLQLNLKKGSLSEYAKFYETLARSPLMDLSITVPSQWEQDIQRHRLVSGFGKLNELTIEAGFNVLEKVISHVDSSTLSALSLHTTRGDGLKQDWKPLISLIFRRWESSLQFINLDLQYTSPPASFQSVFGSLDNLPNLREFHLSRYSPIKITEKDVLVLAKNCTGIENLSLISGGDIDNVTPSLRSLIHLSNHCPRLVALQISLSSDLTLPLDTSSSICRQKALWILYIGGMPLWPDSLDPQTSRTYAVARYLDRIFSRLEHVKNWTAPWDPCWQGVEFLVQAFQAVRAEEARG